MAANSQWCLQQPSDCCLAHHSQVVQSITAVENHTLHCHGLGKILCCLSLASSYTAQPYPQRDSTCTRHQPLKQTKAPSDLLAKRQQHVHAPTILLLAARGRSSQILPLHPVHQCCARACSTLLVPQNLHKKPVLCSCSLLLTTDCCYLLGLLAPHPDSGAELPSGCGSSGL